MSKKLDRYEFIWKAIQKHGYRYDYRKVNYINNKTKVCIICPEHGEFWQTPDSHLRGNGCSKCGRIICGNVLTLAIEDFVQKAKEIHGYKYDYSKVEYKGVKTKVCIVCPEHGEFWQTPDNHINQKQGCPICGGSKKLVKNDFIDKAKEIHGNKYDYSKVDYINNKTKVCIVCPEHGEFWQKPNDHLNGNGCPKCTESKLECLIRKKLEYNNISFIYEYKPLFLKTDNGQQSIDFYLPDYNIGIECQGIQHFKPIKWFGGENKYFYTISMDKRKKKLCDKENVMLLYYVFDENYSDNVTSFNDITKLFNCIYEYCL